MPTIDASIGSLSANSYLTEAEADTYFDGHIDSSVWDNSTIRVELLIHCTRLLDQYMDWAGDRVADEDEQSLDWPRYNVTGILETAIPVKLKNAVCEFAVHMVNNGSSFDTASAKSIVVGPIEIELDTQGAGYLVPPSISGILNNLGSAKAIPKNGISTVAVIR